MVIVTKIHSKYYNIENFEHPGGGDAIWHSYGRDSTAMFEMYHPFVNKEKLQHILQKYEISCDEAKSYLLTGEDNVPQFEYNTDFSNEIKQQVAVYFQCEANKKNTTIRKITKASTSRWTLIVFLILLRLLSIFWWLSGSIYGLFTFPLFSWLSAANTFHDACHFSLSDNWKINKLCGYLGYELTTPLLWYYQHNISHHSYTNIVNKDVDLYHASYLLRLSTFIKFSLLNTYQNYGFLLHWTMSYFGVVINPIIRRINNTMYYKIIPTYDNLISQREMFDKFMLLFYIVLRYIIPYYLNYSISLIIIPTLIYGLLFMINSQITHLHEDTFHNEKDWYKHQVLTSSNHSIGSKFGYLFSGGLNYQIEHHLFPGVNHCHYPYIQPIVEKICKKHKITYKRFNGYRDAFCSYYKHIVKLSYDENGLKYK
jgi:fatty acid desaturase